MPKATHSYTTHDARLLAACCNLAAQTGHSDAWWTAARVIATIPGNSARAMHARQRAMKAVLDQDDGPPVCIEWLEHGEQPPAARRRELGNFLQQFGA